MILYPLTRISHKFLEKIAARLTGIAFQLDEDSVQATRPRPAEREDRSTECASFPRNGEKCGLTVEKFDAAIFDLDGVITQSAKVHARAWKEMFDEFLNDYYQGNYVPFDLEKDYRRHVDGKPRYKGVESFLRSRNIQLPFGSAGDMPEKETICGLGNRKNLLFQKYVKEDGVEVYAASVDLIHKMRKAGLRIGLVTSSKNCSLILRAAGIEKLFDVQVDGLTAEERNLQGKPEPDIFLYAAELLHVPPERASVFEDSLAGVEAGVKGRFGCVVAVNRRGEPEEFLEKGAHMVVADLKEIQLEGL